MKSLFRLVWIAGMLWSPGGASPATGAGTPRIPFGFVENRGQFEPEVLYAASGPDLKAWFERGAVVVKQGAASARIEFAGAARDSRIEPLEETGASVNYLHGSDPTRWRTGVPLYGAVLYCGMWTGIDIVYRGEAGRLKAEYRVAPGADISRIRLRYDGDAAVGADGGLAIRGRSGEITETAPVLYQTAPSGEHQTVPGAFRLIDRRTVGFEASYDRSRPLIIDPPILFSGYFGGSAQQQITAIAVTWTNRIVVAGWTSSTDLPASSSALTATGGGVDAFVAAFSPAGGQLVYCTYLGGSGDDRAFGIAVDAELNTYVTGWTSSTNFPLAGGVRRALGGTRDAFITKLNPSGNALVYSTYFGGSGVDWGTAIALDSSNGAIVAGNSASTDLPVSPASFQAHLTGTQNAFVARLNSAGSAVIGVTYLGGGGTDAGAAVQVDASGRIYVAGSTTSTNFPVASAYQAHSGGGQDGFLAALAADASSLVFSTYLGGSSGSAGSPEEVNGLALDPEGNVIVAGTTSSSDFPVTAGAFQTIFGGQTDGFIAKFSGAGQIIDSTFLGGSGTDGINAIALDFHGYAHVVGYTGSTDFPAQRPIQSANAGLMDAFVTKLNGALSGLVYSTYLGGSLNDSANAIAVDAQTGIVIAGETGSSDFPVSGSMAQSLEGSVSAFLAKVSPGFHLGFAFSPLFFRDPWNVRGFGAGASTNTASSFGLPGDIPLIGDWDGTGVKRIGVFRSGVWYLDINNDGVFDAGDKTVAFGQSGDVPVLGDWDGTGRVNLGLFRAGTFILDLSGHLSGVPTGNQDASFSFGAATDIPVAGDWNGSGTTKVGVFRAGAWLVDYNGDHVFNSLDQTWTYGEAGDIPVVADWDGSGTAKIGVYRDGLWILDYDGDRQMTSWTANELVLGYGGPSLLFRPLVW